PLRCLDSVHLSVRAPRVSRWRLPHPGAPPRGEVRPPLRAPPPPSQTLALTSAATPAGSTPAQAAARPGPAAHRGRHGGPCSPKPARTVSGTPIAACRAAPNAATTLDHRLVRWFEPGNIRTGGCVRCGLRRVLGVARPASPFPSSTTPQLDNRTAKPVRLLASAPLMATLSGQPRP